MSDGWVESRTPFGLAGMSVADPTRSRSVTPEAGPLIPPGRLLDRLLPVRRAAACLAPCSNVAGSLNALSTGVIVLQSAAIKQERRRRATDPDTPQFYQVNASDKQSPRDELIAGLLQANARMAPKFLNDDLGSHLFEAITCLDEYYPTRTEAAIFDQYREEIARSVGPGCAMIDLGAGNCAKAMRLFDSLQPARYVAVDISVTYVRRSVERLAAAFPRIAMSGVGMDFSESLDLPPALQAAIDADEGTTLHFYPGSSIGNFTPPQALGFIRRIREQSPGGGLMIGVDLVKPADQLRRAYDDALGVTAAFNRNILRHANRLIGADFEPAQWRHVALYNEVLSRVEMHLESSSACLVRWDGGERRFADGERIHTESACKYNLERFTTLLRQAGFGQIRHWTDPAQRYAMFHALAG